MQSIWQFASSVLPPLLHAPTWSASISLSSQILVLLELSVSVHMGQLDLPSALASSVFLLYVEILVASSNRRTFSRLALSCEQPLSAYSKTPLLFVTA